MVTVGGGGGCGAGLGVDVCASHSSAEHRLGVRTAPGTQAEAVQPLPEVPRVWRSPRPRRKYVPGREAEPEMEKIRGPPPYSLNPVSKLPKAR